MTSLRERARRNRVLYKDDQRPWYGVGGVDVYSQCFSGKFEYCGWQIIGDAINIDPFLEGIIDISPTVVPHFDPVACYIFGIDPSNPSVNLRFTVSAVTVGGEPQLAFEKNLPDGGSVPGSAPELLGDAYNRSDQPIIVDWNFFSTPTLGAPLNINFFNLNPIPIRIFVSLWGNAIDQPFIDMNRRREDEEEMASEILPRSRPFAHRRNRSPTNGGLVAEDPRFLRNEQLKGLVRPITY